ncbi:MAG: DUF4290 domain-containing protein [Bacteroidia bacterium]|nr:DUF4290 domain-containing protein [Bacteroidia bacterium]
MEHNMAYNTQSEPLVISEYGRSVQEMVKHMCSVPDRIKRNELARTMIQIMINLNPGVKELENYEQKLWDHLYIISNFELDVDGPFEKPSRESVEQKPQRIPYKDELIKFRFYGRNLQTMVEQAIEIEDQEIKTAFINYIASFMVNSSRNWNDENLDKATVIQHLRTLSKGALNLTEDDLHIHIEANRNRNKNGKPKNKAKKFNRGNKQRKRR